MISARTTCAYAVETPYRSHQDAGCKYSPDLGSATATPTSALMRSTCAHHRESPGKAA